MLSKEPSKNGCAISSEVANIERGFPARDSTRDPTRTKFVL